MKIQTDNLRLTGDAASLAAALMQLLPAIARQVNNLSEGRITASHNAMSGPPERGLWQRGDYIRNTLPVVVGTVGSQYVVKGWVCVQSGEPGTWAQDRGWTGT